MANRRDDINADEDICPLTTVPISVSTSPSVSSNLCQKSDTSGSSLSTLLSNSSFRSTEELERARSRSRSRSVNTSLAWSSAELGLALSSPDTISEVEAGGQAASPDHLVSRRTVLERIGLAAVEQGLKQNWCFVCFA